MSAATVLVIDDDPHVRHLWDDALSAAGYTVHLASSAAEGMHLAANVPVGLVLMDDRMPGMTGLDATRRLRADPNTSHIPVLLVTGSSALTTDEIASAGCTGFLRKPVPLSMLYDLVGAALARAAA
jgi:two-component system, cell cycle response regulator DivK